MNKGKASLPRPLRGSCYTQTNPASPFSFPHLVYIRGLYLAKRSQKRQSHMIRVNHEP